MRRAVIISLSLFWAGATTALLPKTEKGSGVVRAVDAGGFASTNRFDALDRIKLAAGPAIVSVTPTNVPSPGGPTTNIVQQVSTYLYDSSGKVLTISNALRERIITTRDALDRVVRTDVRGSNDATVRLTVTAYAANHHSVTTTNGSGALAIASTTYTDNDGNVVLSARYPASDVVEFDLQSFDAAGNRVALQQASRTTSQVTVWSTNGWTYDGLNRVKTAAVRDGAISTFSYNSAGNLTNRAMPGGLTWRATYNTAGQRLLEYDIGAGNLASRTNNYSYFASNSPYAGLLQTRTDGRGVTCAYVYDDWLRVATNTHSGASNYHNLTAFWKYDARGLLTNVTESFASTNTGPTVAIRRSYDAYRLLTSELIYTNNVLFSSANQAWDSAGRRDGLGYLGFGYDFNWQADGLLASALGNTGGGNYSYNDAGQLVSRTLGPKVLTVTSRDGAGRPLGLTTTLSGTNLLVESIAYTGDGRTSTHSLSRPDFTDSRAYFYADHSRRLIEERLNLDASKRWTNTFAYDAGQAGGAGVLTKSVGTSSTSSPSNTWSGGTDGLARVNAETNNAIRRSADGRVNGLATISATLDGQPMPVTALINSNGGQWRSTLELTPGAHQLTASAKHPSGLFTTNATIWFTNTASAPDRVEVTYDGNGQITKRLWRSANGTTNRTQTLTWDARGRLYKVVERDTQTNGFDWTAVYDALGRRLSTTEIPVTNNVSVTSQTLTLSQHYDPEVEFLELAVSVNGATTWKIFGPDLNGVYGGLNGLGGFDAIIPGPELFCPTIGDARGNILAVYDVTHGSLAWNASRPTGYGAAPTYRPPPLGRGANIIQASAWRGRWMDVIGSYQIGLRAYLPEAGAWTSPDSLGHDGSDNLLSFADGDPINRWDSDGRYGKAVDTLPGAQGAGFSPNDFYKYAGTDARYHDEFDQRFLSQIQRGTDLYPYGNLNDLDLQTAVDRGYMGSWDRPLLGASDNNGYRVNLTGFEATLKGKWGNLGPIPFGLPGVGIMLLTEGAFGSMAGTATRFAPEPGFEPPLNGSSRATWQDFLGEAQARLNASRAEYGEIEAFAMAGQRVPTGRSPGLTIDPVTGQPVGRFIGNESGPPMIEPVGGSTRGYPNPTSVDTHTFYPNGANYQRLNPVGHGNNPTPHAHGHAPGTGPGMMGQGPSLDTSGNVVPWNSPAAHWPYP